MLVWQFRTGSASSRAASAVSALKRAAGGSLKAVRRSRKLYQVRVGSKVVASVTSADARAAGSTPAALAGQWAAKLREAMALPPLVFGDSSIRAPNGGAVRLPLMGSKAHLAKVETQDADTAKVRRVPGGVEIVGVQNGEAVVTAQAGEAVATLNVAVRPYAVKLPQTVTVYVSGAPALASTVEGAVQRALNTELGATPDAWVSFEAPPGRQVPAGSATVFNVRVRAGGSESISAEGVAQVVVRNLGLAMRREAELWYSNDPESVPALGSLFAGELLANTPTRVLYHHSNVAAYPMSLQVYALNDSDKSARVAILPGDAEPSKNPVLAGFNAGDRFLRNWMNQSAEVITLAPNTGLPISLHTLRPQQTASGLCTLWLLSGGPDRLRVRVDARAPFEASGKWAAATDSDTPWRIIGPIAFKEKPDGRPEASPHVYPTPFREESATYQVGGNLGYVRIGEKAIGRQDGQAKLSGNFGVCYRIKARFENATQSPAECELVFEASAGYTGAIFVVNGAIVRTPLLPPKGESKLARFRLEPGASKEFSVVTFPLSGGSYPATLTLRPVDYVAPVNAGGHPFRK